MPHEDADPIAPHGVNAYQYWNIALEKGGRSRWGWAQNSLVVVATQNDMGEELPFRVRVGESVVSATLPPDSFNTFLVPPA